MTLFPRGYMTSSGSVRVVPEWQSEFCNGCMVLHIYLRQKATESKRWSAYSQNARS